MKGSLGIKDLFHSSLKTVTESVNISFSLENNRAKIT